MGVWGTLGMQMAGQAGQGALGIAAARIGKNYDRKQWVKDFETQNPYLMQQQQQLLDMQAKKEYEMWLKTGIGGQMQEMKKAGVNPALLLGMSGSGGATVGGGGPQGTSNYGTDAGTSAILANKMMGIDPADTMLKMSQVKLNEVQANKLSGVDTDKTKAETSSLLAGIENTNAKTELTKIETRIAKIDEWIKDRSKEDAADQIMWNSEKSMNEMNNLWREGLLSAAQYQDKVELLKKELAGKILTNELTSQLTKESKSKIDLNNADIYKKQQEILQGWEKLSQSEKIMKVEALAKEYELLYKGAIGNWRLANPEVTTKQIDKVMGLEQKKK